VYRAVRARDKEAAQNAMRDHLMRAQKAQESEEMDDSAVVAAGDGSIS
jgi:DNA-binding FadR family transcriptional regulator